MKYNKFRELKVNIFDIEFENFSIKKILNYMPAGNDVLEVLTDSDETYFVKIERSKVADFEAEYRNILALKKIGYNHIPNVVQFIDNSDLKCLVLEKISGDRLSDIISDDNKQRYMLNLGRELSIIHSINSSEFKTAKQRVINDIPYDGLYSKFDDVAIKYVKYLKENNYEKVMDTFIHGDFHYANILWYNNAISGVLDWEYSGLGHKEQDIAWALVVRPGQQFFKSLDDITMFLNGYKEKLDYDSSKLKWCLINAYLHFYLMNTNLEYRNLLCELMDLVMNSTF